jgi:hypothetical protein
MVAKKERMSRILDPLGYLVQSRLEEEACHFVLAAFLSFLLGFSVARRQCHLRQEVRGPREKSCLTGSVIWDLMKA